MRLVSERALRLLAIKRMRPGENLISSSVGDRENGLVVECLMDKNMGRVRLL